MNRLWTAADVATPPAGVTVIDITGRTGGLGAAFAPERRFADWHRMMTKEMLQKEGKDRASFHHLLSTMVDGRYRQTVVMIRRDQPQVWADLLSVDAAILVCPCSDLALCHRRVLGAMLRTTGAQHLGEWRGVTP